MKKSKETVEQYIWGDDCVGWRLMNDENLSVIHEKMPPGTKEAKHYHEKSSQFFFILIGKAEFDMNGEIHIISQHEGIEVPPQTPHQIFNKSNDSIEFLVISQPTTRGDRITLD